MRPRTMSLAAVVALLGSAALGVAQEEAAGRVVTVTRLVKIFSELEGQWMDAVKRKDEVAVQRFLADDFELRSSAAPAAPVPRGEWLKNALASGLRTFSFREMAARELGPVVVVSARYVQQADVAAGEFLVVDVWAQRAGEWKVLARYAAPAGPGAVPGFGPPPEAPPRK